MRRFALLLLLPAPLAAQVRPDTSHADAATVLAPITVSVSRDARALQSLPAAVAAVDSPMIARARPTWGLDEALVTVPGGSPPNPAHAYQVAASATFVPASGPKKVDRAPDHGWIDVPHA